MTDFVVTDGLVFVDSESHGLANKVVSRGVAVDSVDLGGSHYTLIITSTANATEAVVGTRKVLAVIVDAAVAADIDTEGPRILGLEGDAAATETITATARVLKSFAESAAATESVDTGALTAAYSGTANATATLALSRPMVIAESAAASETVTTTRRVTASFSESAGASNSLTAPAAMDGSETAAATETVTATRLGVVSPSESAAATETVTATGHKTLSLKSTGNATSTVTAGLHAIASISDEANATERVRTSADTIGNFWCGMNGAATLWNGLPFQSMVEGDGVIYGAGVDGLYAMDNEQDDGIDVASSIAWDLMDFESPQRKRWEGLYVLGAAPSPYTLWVINHKGRFKYKTTKTRETDVVQHRAEPGRGLESVKYRVILEHTKPHATDAATAEFQRIARRV